MIIYSPFLKGVPDRVAGNAGLVRLGVLPAVVPLRVCMCVRVRGTSGSIKIDL